MIEIFNAISNIAEQIEKDIFKGVSDEFFGELVDKNH
jgi:hypothetical protein